MSTIGIILRAIVLVLSFLSFIPQSYRIWSRRDYSGVTLYYALFNSMIFTEHFSLGLHFIVNNTGFENTIVESPPTAENWLDLFQFCVVWYCYLLLFTLCLYYPPRCSGKQYTALAISMLFTLISLIPVVVESYIPLNSNERQCLATFITTLHRYFISPIITTLAIASVYPQARETLSRSSPGALSTKGLATQAVIFTFITVYWPFRLQVTLDPWSLITWYQVVGWATIDNAIFVVVQAVLFYIVIRQHWSSSNEETLADGERAPLIQD